ncbi:MAG TPA: AAA family ATPase [Candidatus Acidoferrales bacterium]|nr:AAA family ATPase [Candidatus Acidoferrales bacterium]
MAIRKIKVTNFKSFGKLDVDLGEFNVVVGANASGKSNFINVLKFLRDIKTFSLRDAISLQGGVSYLRNMNLGASADLSIEVDLKPTAILVPVGRRRGKFLGMASEELVYGFSLRFNKRGLGFQIVEDHLSSQLAVSEVRSLKGKPAPDTLLGRVRATAKRSGNRFTYDVEIPPEIPIKRDDIWPSFVTSRAVSPKTLLCESPFYFFLSPLGPLFADIGIYDFDPKIAKKAVQITGRADLEEAGGNLALALRGVLDNKDSRRKLVNLLREILPFVEETGVQRLADRSILFTIRERYFHKEDLPGSMVSDGTAGILALIVALYFERKPITVIEEPERNIHPYLISKVVEMTKDASKGKQIVVTTHNPQIVRHSGPENLLLVSRDSKGFSTISRPADKLEVKEFLKNEIGIEELFAQNLLEI